jgi:hypothetical protein
MISVRQLLVALFCFLLIINRASSSEISINYRCNSERTGSYKTPVGPTKRLMTKWSTSIDRYDRSTFIVLGDTLYASDKYFVYKLDNKGKILSKYKIEYTKKMVAYSNYLVVYSPGRLRIVDTIKNKIINEIGCKGDGCLLVVYNNYLVYMPFFVTYYEDTYKPFIYCYDLLNEREQWKKEINTIGKCIAINNNKVVILSIEADKQNYKTNIACFNITDGTDYWINQFEIIADDNLSIMDNKIYFTSSDYNQNTFKAISLSLDNGKKLWECQVNEKINIHPMVLLNSKIYFVDFKNIMCICANSGKLLWNQDILLNSCDPILESNKLYLYLSLPDSIMYNREYKDYYANLFCFNVDMKKYIFDKLLLGNINSEIQLSNKKMYISTVTKDKFFVYCLSNASDKVSFILDNNICRTDDGTLIMDVKPTVIKNTTYIPAKYLVDTLGGDVTWNSKENLINCTLQKKGSDKNNDYVLWTVQLWINNSKAKINTKQVQIEPKNPKITPIIINGRTMVPLRFLAESLGCKVEWKADTKEIIVTYQP